jgi:hypothetical protein
MTWTTQKMKKLGGDAQTHREQGDLIGLLLFFQNQESRLKEKGIGHKYIS